MFDNDHDEQVDFNEFIELFNIFRHGTSARAKLEIAFRIYDIDCDGYISNGELFTVLKMMVGSNLTDQQLQQVVDKTIFEADKDGDGKICFDEFCDVLNNLESLGNKMNISLD
eukprot:CAMPEP_0117429888 /NCGR_PEP_ID=MMETSP0758-20121206/9432_1 /TAXON_ID=63605 /ORGANISM="Percolomonas cosmopolitus, Strain AE-1 (ATCC 50343)" /LENGTH=112 /DNA_ID=CAMNT_0005217367 /DNA_START=218 /DNA_END=556 /DNA_ORIENTATION=+